MRRIVRHERILQTADIRGRIDLTCEALKGLVIFPIDPQFCEPKTL